MPLFVTETSDSIEFRYREPLNRYAFYKFLFPAYGIAAIYWAYFHPPDWISSWRRYELQFFGSMSLVFGTASLLDTFFGETSFHFSATHLTVQRSVFGIGRSRRFLIANFKRPAIKDERRYWGLLPHRYPSQLLLNDHNGKTSQLCHEFTWYELDDMLTLVGRKFPSIADQWNVPNRPNLVLEPAKQK